MQSRESSAKDHTPAEHSRRCRALIVPVGGSPEPVRKAIETARPEFVVFVASPYTARAVETILASAGYKPSSSRRLVTRDPQTLDVTFRILASGLQPALSEWNVSWLETLVDLTGGTKVMTAALALATIHRTPRYLYIGGQDRSDRGVVATGTEVPIEAVNLWNELAYDALRDVARAFNRLRFAEASEGALKVRERVSDPALKSYLFALAKVIDGFAAWDRFDYREASLCLARGIVDDVRLFWDGKPQFDASRVRLDKCRVRLRDLTDTLSDAGAQQNVPPRSVLDDLLANAWRRGYVERGYDLRRALADRAPDLKERLRAAVEARREARGNHPAWGAFCEEVASSALRLSSTSSPSATRSATRRRSIWRPCRPQSRAPARERNRKAGFLRHLPSVAHARAFCDDEATAQAGFGWHSRGSGDHERAQTNGDRPGSAGTGGGDLRSRQHRRPARCRGPADPATSRRSRARAGGT